MATRTIKTKLGDIIAIPVYDDLYAFGQIIQGEMPICFIIYDTVADLHTPFEQIINKPIFILTYITDKIIRIAKWLVIGNAAISQKILIPEYKIATVEEGVRKYMVTDYTGRMLRPATEQEINKLKSQNLSTPAVIVDTIRAKHGIIPWQECYNELLYEG